MMARRGRDVTCGEYDGRESVIVIVIGRLAVPLSIVYGDVAI